MASNLQRSTLFPALFLFFLSIVFSVITLVVVDFGFKQLLLILTMSFFIGGIILAVYWGYSWVLSKKFHERESGFFVMLLSHSRFLGLLLLLLGAVILIWVSGLVWNDVFVWKKDLAVIFFGSRVGENISLGLGVVVVHYFFVGLTFVLLSLVVLFHRSRFCPHYFGYLGSRYRNTPMHPKCLHCHLKADCIGTDKRFST
ncbi:hypothetical protein KJN74_04975 [Candidatus Bathyarchaeota archaeon]|nr:hypothetical protein [Candidatus Bathyarchaeota archaeon]